MKKLAILLLCSMMLTGCSSEDPAMTKFQNEMNDFCDNLKNIDTSINQITNITADEAGLAAATDDLLYQLDKLDDEFAKFSNIDFPTDYDYLEQYADEASDYMTEAVKSYHTVYEDNYTVSMEEYAKENYSRAYKRVQIILDVLHGQDPNA
ncbi:MAG: hypothetical protein IJX63_01125 [Lachnospiraceae bacterium]|nr:hypothetical protein [Lachnospiraceae bacterium]